MLEQVIERLKIFFRNVSRRKYGEVCIAHSGVRGHIYKKKEEGSTAEPERKVGLRRRIAALGVLSEWGRLKTAPKVLLEFTVTRTDKSEK